MTDPQTEQFLYHVSVPLSPKYSPGPQPQAVLLLKLHPHHYRQAAVLHILLQPQNQYVHSIHKIAYNSHIADNAPRSFNRKITISTGSISRRMASDNKFSYHSWYSKRNNTQQINENKSRTAILPRHI